MQQVDLVPGRYLVNYHPFSGADVLEREVTVTADTVQFDLDTMEQVRPVLEPRTTRFIRPSYRFDHKGLETLTHSFDSIGGAFGFSPASRTGRDFDLEWAMLSWGDAFEGRVHLDETSGTAASSALVVRIDGVNTDPHIAVLRLKVAERLPLLAVVPVFAGGTRVYITHRGTDPIVEALSNDPTLRSAIAALSEVGQNEAEPVLDWLMRQTDGRQGAFWETVVIALLHIHCGKPMPEYYGALYPLQDMGIAKAWSVALHADAAIGEREAEVLSALMTVHGIGGPVFRYSYTLALSLLEALRGTAQGRGMREIAVKQMGRWIARGDRRVSDGPFTVYEDDGTLGPPYATIASWQSLASDTLTDGGFRLNAIEVWPVNEERETMTDTPDPTQEIATLSAELIGIPLTSADFGQMSRDPAIVLGAGAIIVALAQLGWAIYTDLRAHEGRDPTSAELEAVMNEQVGERTGENEEIYEVVIQMTIRVGKTRTTR